MSPLIKTVLLSIIFISVISCHKDFKKDINLKSPQYFSTERDFIKSIVITDSISIGSEIQQDANIISNSITYNLLVYVYSVEVINKSECKKITELMKSSKTGISNLKEFDVIKYFNGSNNEFIYEERITK